MWPWKLGDQAGAARFCDDGRRRARKCCPFVSGPGCSLRGARRPSRRVRARGQRLLPLLARKTAKCRLPRAGSSLHFAVFLARRGRRWHLDWRGTMATQGLGFGNAGRAGGCFLGTGRARVCARACACACVRAPVRALAPTCLCVSVRVRVGSWLVVWCSVARRVVWRRAVVGLRVWRCALRKPRGCCASVVEGCGFVPGITSRL